MHLTYLLLLLHLTLLSPTHAQQSALFCTAHPAHKPSWTPVLIRSFALLPRHAHRHAVYMPRLSNFDYHPINDPTNTRYARLDFFHASQAERHDDLARLYFQRGATVYLFVGATVGIFKANPSAVAKLPGWTSHGWAQLPTQSGTEMLTYGVHQYATFRMHRYAQVFSKKSVGNTLVVPSKHWVARNFRASFRSLETHLQFRIGERNGRASPPVGSFQGITIEPNQRCSDALHDAWKVPDSNRGDDDTRGTRFHSWHPAWDPCFWCAYDHEHGSSAYHLMGYKPKFDLTAYKNDREDESDAGFKSFVFQSGSYMVYFNVHAQTSNLRRITEAYHTIAIAITDAKTKELMLELSHKADYGFLGGRGKSAGEVIPLSKKDAEMQEKQKSKNVKRRFRAVNVVDVNNPDPRFGYARSLTLGGYEKWVTMPICADGPPFGEILVDLKTPVTGIKSYKHMDVKVNLGNSQWRNVGTQRSIHFKRLQFSQKHCKFLNTNEPVSGYFYTDAKGTTLLQGPGKKAIRQFIRDGFEIEMSGVYGVFELWLGLHMQGYPDGHFKDSGFGLDPDMN